MNYLIVTDIPCEIFLKYAVSECTAKLVDDSVKTGFGGVRLPTTVKDTNKLFTDLSNLVAVKVHSGHTVVVVNSGVTHVPIGVVLDGSVHEHFNLTHVLLGSVVNSVRERISGDSVVVDILNLLTDCRGQLDALCFHEVVAHLQIGLHVVDEGNESVAERKRHGRLLEYLRSMAKIGVNCNPWWTVRQVSLMSPLTTTSDGTRDTV